MAEKVESKDSKDVDNKPSTDTEINTDTNVNTSAQAEQSTAVDHEMSVDDDSLSNPFEGMSEQEIAAIQKEEMTSVGRASEAGRSESLADTTAKLKLESSAQNQGLSPK